MNPHFTLPVLALLVAGLPAGAAGPDDLDRRLTFEDSRAGAAPVGWGGGPGETLFADSAVIHGGSWSARIERSATSAGKFSTLTTWIPVDFAGEAIELRGFL